VLNREVIDAVITVADQDALKTARELARRKGILCGISSGAARYYSCISDPDEW
jgi:cysteine synthase A